jgi:hypothetical protein
MITQSPRLEWHCRLFRPIRARVESRPDALKRSGIHVSSLPLRVGLHLGVKNFARRQIWLASIAFTAILLWGGPAALASGPDMQLVNPNFESVVRILYDKNLGGGVGEFEGTGSVIDYRNIGGEGWLCVLTADHVVSSNGKAGGSTRRSPGIAFGNAPNDTGNSVYMKAYNVFRPNFSGGPKNVDIAVLTLDVGKYDPASKYKSLVRTLEVAHAFFPFSLIGYGNAGKLVADGYKSLGKYGTERYLTDKIATFNTTYKSPGGYAYDSAQWIITDPRDGEGKLTGRGTGRNGDSGSSLFSAVKVHDDKLNLDYYTDEQFAVYTGSIRPRGTRENFIPFGSIGRSVALDNADINWIRRDCALANVPEPPSIVTFGAGGALLVGLTALRRARPLPAEPA